MARPLDQRVRSALEWLYMKMRLVLMPHAIFFGSVAMALCCFVAFCAGHELSTFGVHTFSRHHVSKLGFLAHVKGVNVLNLAPHIERLEASLPNRDFAFSVQNERARRLEVTNLSRGLDPDALGLPAFTRLRETTRLALRTDAVYPTGNSICRSLAGIFVLDGDSYWAKLVRLVGMPTGKDLEDIDVGSELPFRVGLRSDESCFCGIGRLLCNTQGLPRFLSTQQTIFSRFHSSFGGLVPQLVRVARIPVMKASATVAMAMRASQTPFHGDSSWLCSAFWPVVD